MRVYGQEPCIDEILFAISGNVVDKSMHWKEGVGEDDAFSSSYERDGSKSNISMDESKNGDDLTEREQLEYSSEDEDMDISDSEGTLLC